MNMLFVKPAVRVRYSCPADIREMASIDRGSFVTPWDEATYRRLLVGPGPAAGLVAVAGGPVVGHLLYRLTPPRPEVVRLAVDPRWRRLGVGRALVGALADERLRGREAVDMLVPEGPDADPFGACKFMTAVGFAATKIVLRAEGGGPLYLFRRPVGACGGK